MVHVRCGHIGCPELVEKPYRFCFKHKNEYRKSSTKKEVNPFYKTARWARMRKIILARDPVCLSCKRNPSTDVDHIKPMSEGGEGYDESNLQGLCHSCHSTKTSKALGQNTGPVLALPADGRFLCPVTLVAGPPAAGKSSYVLRNMSRGHIVIDIDMIAETLTQQPMYFKPWPIANAAIHAKDAILRYLMENRDALEIPQVWVVAGAPKRSEREQYEQAGAKVILFKKSLTECLRNIDIDPRRASEKLAWQSRVESWFDKFEE